jgi:hypothetical protein
MNENTVVVKLTAAVVIDGRIVRAGTKVEMIDAEAKTLLRLGKAELDTVPNDAPSITEDAAQQAAAAQAAAEAAAEAAAKTIPAAPAAPAVATK